MILITGASGFIGQRLLMALVKEYGVDEVLALTSKPLPTFNYLLHWNYAFNNNYLIESGYGAIETIIHCGAFIPKDGNNMDSWINCSSNIDSTVKLLGLELPNLKKFIFLSSVDIYANDCPLTEQSLVGPSSLYGYSKLYCEKMIASWAQATETKYSILRVGHIYGPGEQEYQKFIPVTIRKILNKQPLQIWGTGEEIRSFLYIDNLIEAILIFLKKDIDLDVLNLVGGSRTTIKELVELLIRIGGVAPTIDVLPGVRNRKDLYFDNTKMQEEIGLREMPIEEGLLREFEYMKQFKS